MMFPPTKGPFNAGLFLRARKQNTTACQAAITRLRCGYIDAGGMDSRPAGILSMELPLAAIDGGHPTGTAHPLPNRF